MRVGPSPAGAGPPACRIARFGLMMSDVRRSEEFYAAAFGCETIRRGARDPGFAELAGIPGAMTWQTRMRLGRQEFDLVACDPPGRPYPPGSTSSDLWFQHLAVVVSDIDVAHARVRRAGQIMPITDGGPVELPCASGGVRAFKFRDADGHPLELLAFRREATPEPWQRQIGPGVFLGIDHTAIAVADPARSIAFFRSSFGLTPATRTENIGAEQTMLDGLANARVIVAGLNPVNPVPHLELLGYQTGTRRPVPVAASNDIAATQVVLQTPDLEQTFAALSAGSARFVSPGIRALGDGTRAIMILDPDGHRFVVEEAT